MTLYRDSARLAIVPLSALHEQILSDLDAGLGGVGWWKDHLDTPRRILIGDYVLSLLHSTEDNLVEAVMHAHQVTKAWDTEDAWLRRRRMTRSVNPGWLKPTEDIENLRVETGAHLGGFFRAVGSVVDNIAGLVIGVGGLRCDIVKADAGDLRLDKQSPKGALGEEHRGRPLQLSLIEAVRTAIADGPTEWWPWVSDMRNTQVHRARRMYLQMDDHDRPSGTLRPLPQSPDWTDAEAFVRARKPLGDALHEDARLTVQGILEAVIHSVAAISISCGTTWDHRRRDPDLIPQPRENWPKLLRGSQRGFPGVAPRRRPRLPEMTGLHLHPSRARRLKAGKMLGEDLQSWQTWLSESQ